MSLFSEAFFDDRCYEVMREIDAVGPQCAKKNKETRSNIFP